MKCANSLSKLNLWGFKLQILTIAVLCIIATAVKTSHCCTIIAVTTQNYFLFCCLLEISLTSIRLYNFNDSRLDSLRGSNFFSIISSTFFNTKRTFTKKVSRKEVTICFQSDLCSALVLCCTAMCNNTSSFKRDHRLHVFHSIYIFNISLSAVN